MVCLDTCHLAGRQRHHTLSSMAKENRDEKEDFDLTILYGSVSVNDIILKEELDALQCDKVKVIHVLNGDNLTGRVKPASSAEISSGSIPLKIQLTSSAEAVPADSAAPRHFPENTLNARRTMAEEVMIKISITYMPARHTRSAAWR
ncbi:MAG: hypothetical protein IKD69_02250 [Solobacterium sp.]|nr:hypothetical protein [Solobacterium sp.]